MKRKDNKRLYEMCLLFCGDEMAERRLESQLFKEPQILSSTVPMNGNDEISLGDSLGFVDHSYFSSNAFLVILRTDCF